MCVFGLHPVFSFSLFPNRLTPLTLIVVALKMVPYLSLDLNSVPRLVSNATLVLLSCFV